MSNLLSIPARAILACYLVPFMPVIIRGQQPGTGPSPNVRETRISGVLLTSADRPQAGKRVVLVKVRILDLEGKELPELPSRGTVILDSDTRAPVATARTDTAGRFEFTTVKPGPYAVGVTARSDGAYAAGQVTLLRNPRDAFDTLVFRVSPGKDLELGNVIPKEK